MPLVKHPKPWRQLIELERPLAVFAVDPNAELKESYIHKISSGVSLDGSSRFQSGYP